MDKSLKKKVIAVCAVTLAMSGLVFFKEITTSRIYEIERNTYGGGSKKEQYEVTVGNEAEETIDLEVMEREYTDEEIRKVFKNTMDQLEKIILDENKSADHVEYDLNLITKMPEQPIEISWQSDRSDIVNSLGKIQEENLTGKGDLVELKGYLTCGEEECLYIVNVRVYPRTLNRKEKLFQSVLKMAESAEKEQREHPTVVLPREMNGQEIVWKKPSEHKAVYMIFLGGMAVVLIYAQEKQKKEKFRKRKSSRWSWITRKL